MKLGNPLADPSMGWRLGITFFFAALLYLAPAPQSMALNILDLATSLVDHGSVELDDYRGIDVAIRDGRVLSGMPPGASFVAALVYLVARPVVRLAPNDLRLMVLHVLCVVLVGLPAAAATVWLVYRTAIRWGASGRSAFVTGGLLAFGTMHFSYATGFYKKTLAAACLMGAFTLLTLETSPRARSLGAGAAGILCGLAIGQDYPTAIIAAVLAGYLLSRRPGTGALLAFASGLGLAILPVLAYHQLAFGSPWVTAYQFRPDPVGNALREPRAGPFLFLVVSLLGASPCLGWSGIGWWRAVRMRERRAEMLTIAGIVLGTLLLFSGWASFYPHEASFASRLLLPMVPFAVLPMAFGLPVRLGRWDRLVIGWSIGATLLAAQATLIPTNTVPPVYALKVLGTSWGTGPLFSEALASWLGLSTLHLVIARKVVTAKALLLPENRSLLAAALLGQGLIKTVSLSVTAVTIVLLWRCVWRPVMACSFRRDPAGRSYETSSQPRAEA